ncbi:MAG: phosphotransacetylase family protein [Candidatus Acetothermia bacterium]|nr:phosphotransacetylase family protein [Candidatus Acetothermia bacterium]
MKVLIASTRTSAGKTVIGLGLGLLTQAQGERVGYFKPLADRLVSRGGLICDRDAELFHTALSIPEEVERLSLIHDYTTLIEDRRGEDLRRTVLERLEELSQGKELMLIEGPRNYSYGSFLGLSVAELGAASGSPILLVANGGLGVVVDKALAAAYFVRSHGAAILGVVINGVREEEREEMAEVAQPALEERGLEVLGIIPWAGELAPLTPRQLAEALNARVLAGEPGLERRVGSVLVGAMTVDQALRGLRRYRDVALITGGDRADMQIAACEVSTSCLILTGGVYPDQVVISKADDLKIPILLVPDDTYTTAQRVEAVEPQLSPKREKLELVERLVRDHVAWERLGR